MEALDPQEIFEQLIKNKKIGIPLAPDVTELPVEITNLINNLAVIKSRAKKLYIDLQMESDWEHLRLRTRLDKLNNLVILELAPKQEPKKFFVQILD